jgi:hypothetical protein
MFINQPLSCRAVKAQLETTDYPERRKLEQLYRKDSEPFIGQIFGENGYETRPDYPGVETIYADGRSELWKTLGGSYHVVRVPGV